MNEPKSSSWNAIKYCFIICNVVIAVIVIFEIIHTVDLADKISEAEQAINTIRKLREDFPFRKGVSEVNSQIQIFNNPLNNQAKRSTTTPNKFYESIINAAITALKIRFGILITCIIFQTCCIILSLIGIFKLHLVCLYAYFIISIIIHPLYFWIISNDAFGWSFIIELTASILVFLVIRELKQANN